MHKTQTDLEEDKDIRQDNAPDDGGNFDFDPTDFPDNVDDDPKPQEGKPKKVKKHWIHPTWLRRTLKVLLGVLIFILIIPVLVYLPPVQDLAISIAKKEIKKSTGMDISSAISSGEGSWPSSWRS